MGSSKRKRKIETLQEKNHAQYYKVNKVELAALKQGAELMEIARSFFKFGAGNQASCYYGSNGEAYIRWYKARKLTSISDNVDTKKIIDHFKQHATKCGSEDLDESAENIIISYYAACHANGGNCRETADFMAFLILMCNGLPKEYNRIKLVYMGGSVAHYILVIEGSGENRTIVLDPWIPATQACLLEHSTWRNVIKIAEKLDDDVQSLDKEIERLIKTEGFKEYEKKLDDGVVQKLYDEIVRLWNEAEALKKAKKNNEYKQKIKEYKKKNREYIKKPEDYKKYEDKSKEYEKKIKLSKDCWVEFWTFNLDGECEFEPDYLDALAAHGKKDYKDRVVKNSTVQKLITDGDSANVIWECTDQQCIEDCPPEQRPARWIESAIGKSEGKKYCPKCENESIERIEEDDKPSFERRYYQLPIDEDNLEAKLNTNLEVYWNLGLVHEELTEGDKFHVVIPYTTKGMPSKKDIKFWEKHHKKMRSYEWGILE